MSALPTPATPCGGRVELANIRKRYGAQTALHDVSLTIEPGEFITLLGPSGSGKTSTLMLVAGFESPDSGEVKIDGRSVQHVPAHRRNQGVVFQHYALFPHMSVYDNLAFPLSVRGLERPTIAAQVGEALQRVGLDGYSHRLPRQLSGGQQQRVALARAMIFKPPVILMDEPLGALDKHLRERMKFEIRQLHQELGLTVLYVTHDQDEALTMSDRIAIMAQGRIAQIGTPEDLYERPANRFVAGFIGETNLIDATLVEAATAVTPCGASLRVGETPRSLPAKAAVTLVVRPERITIAARGHRAAEHEWRDAQVQSVSYLGCERKYRVRSGGLELTIKQPIAAADRDFAAGETITIGWRPTDVRAVRRTDDPEHDA